MNLYQTIARRFSVAAKLFLLTLIFTATIQAQSSSVDLSFNAIPDKNSTSTANFILQPDNKIIVFGNFQVVNGVINNRIARLNTDGNLDNTFNCATCDFGITFKDWALRLTFRHRRISTATAKRTLPFSDRATELGTHRLIRRPITERFNLAHRAICRCRQITTATGERTSRYFDRQTGRGIC